MKSMMKVSPSLDAALRHALAGVAIAASMLTLPLAAHANDAPPTSGAVLGALHDVQPADDATTIDIANGATANFWYGYRVEIGGKTYYTGLVWNTPERYGKPGEDEAGPGDTVNLAETTFVLTHPGQKPAWTWLGSEFSIGEFGAYKKPEEIDTERKPIEHRTAGGRVIVGVPVSSFENGFTLKGYSMFVFNPNRDPDNIEEHVWTYLGRVATDEENAAACDGGAVMPCIARTGEVGFVTGPAEMPQVVVKFKGTTIEGPGKTRELGAADNAVYQFNRKKQSYEAKS